MIEKNPLCLKVTIKDSSAEYALIDQNNALKGQTLTSLHNQAELTKQDLRNVWFNAKMIAREHGASSIFYHNFDLENKVLEAKKKLQRGI